MTVIARAPLRIGLAGGGTDLPAYYEHYEGLVVSTAIDRYVYVIVSDARDDELQVTSADANSVFSSRDHLFDASLFWGADYRLPIEILKHFGIERGRRVFIASEVPPGTGLGSSSSTAVALITALSVDQGMELDHAAIADLACEVEIERMGMPIGRQDQYAAAFGGLNSLRFTTERTTVEPLDVSDKTLRELRERTLLFFTGKRRRSTDILSQQRANTEQTGSKTLEALHKIKQLAVEMREAIETGDLDQVGEILDVSWRHKRDLATGVSNSNIDAWYEEARQAGALGGKITGAGGGGFLLLHVPTEHRSEVIHRLANLGLVWVNAGFDNQGAMPVMPTPVPGLVYAD